MSVSRKVNFFEIEVTEGLPVMQCLDAAIEKWQELHDAKAPGRKYHNAGGDYAQIMSLDKVGHMYYGIITLIKDEFPVVVNKTTDETETLEAELDNEKGIPEETHFVISVHPRHPKPIICVESTMTGAKHRDVKIYLESMLIKSGVPAEFIFDPIYAFKYQDFLDRVSDVAEITLMFHRDEIAQYSQYDPTTGEVIRTVMNFGDSEYVTIKMNIDFRKHNSRYPTEGLLRKLRDLVTVLIQNPQATNYMKRFDVRAKDRTFADRLTLFDLIESKVAIEIRAERRRPRSLYYNSQSIHESIRAQIEKDFESRPSMVLPATR